MLLSAGHDPDRLLTLYSFEQLALFARCILSNRIEMLNAILGPVSGALGAEYEPGRVGEQRKRQRDPAKHRNADFAEVGAKEAALLNALARSPVGARTIKTSASES